MTERWSTSRARRWSAFLLLSLLTAACGSAASPGPGGGPPSPSGSPLTLPALKLVVLEAAGGHLAYCDPDTTPVARGTSLENARARFPTIKADHAVFDAILNHEDLSAGQEFTSKELIAISDDYKQMNAIALEPVAEGYAFDLQALNVSDGSASHLTGTVSRAGQVSISRREAGYPPKCPICLAAGVLISTPQGNVPVQDIRVGMPVWTTNRGGHRIVGVVLKAGHMEAPLGHEVVRLTLGDGRTVVACPGHPTADGRTVGALRPGDRYDGTVVVGATLLPYAGMTWDLLPSGPTGTYFANGVLLGSTLHSSPAKGPHSLLPGGPSQAT